MIFRIPVLSYVLLATSPQPQSEDYGRKIVSLDEMLRSFDLEISFFPDTGRGLKTTRDRKEKDLLLAIPEEVLITSASILAQYPSLNDCLCYKSLSDQQVLALGLCYKRHEVDDYGYVSSLPDDQCSVFSMPQDLIAKLPRTYQQLVESTRAYAVEMFESLSEALSSGNSNMDIPDLDTFLWAFHMVRSRAFGVGQTADDRIRPGKGGQYGALIPGMDLINHRVGTASTLELQNHRWELGSPSLSYSAGDQVFTSYGTRQDQWNFWLTYGFAGQGPPTVAYFDMVDVLDACALAQPTHFTPVLIQTLKEMLAQVQWVSRSMLGYDENYGPSESLARGLDKVTEICEQIGGPTENFAKETLACLLRSRELEIVCSLDGLDMLDLANSESGRGMRDSLRLLLEREMEVCSAKD